MVLLSPTNSSRTFLNMCYTHIFWSRSYPRYSCTGWKPTPNLAKNIGEAKRRGWGDKIDAMCIRNFNLRRNQVRKMGQTCMNAEFSFFLCLHHQNNRVENFSNFVFAPLQLSSQKTIDGYKKYQRTPVPN